MAMKGKEILVEGEKSGADLSPVDKNEMKKLTNMVKLYEYTCTFCFKRFYSAQAMGGHQNAHRRERLQEKKLFVRDPIGYRKRAFLRSVKASLNDTDSESRIAALKSRLLNLHAAKEMVKRETASTFPQKKLVPLRPKPASFEVGESSSTRVALASIVSQNKLASLRINPQKPVSDVAAKRIYFHHPYYNSSFIMNEKPTLSPNFQLNFFPAKELCLAEKVGFHADSAKAKTCNEVEKAKLDLALKL